MKRLTICFLTAVLAFLTGAAAASIGSGMFTCLSVDTARCSNPVAWKDGPPMLTAEDESYAVYGAVLNQGMLRDKDLIVESKTMAGVRFSMPESYYRERFGLTTATVKDYLAENAQSRNLKSDRFGDHLFLSGREIAANFADGNQGWDEFYERFPESEGIVYFSRVGFDFERTQALVYVGYNCGEACGSARFVILKKTNGDWILASE